MVNIPYGSASNNELTEHGTLANVAAIFQARYKVVDMNMTQSTESINFNMSGNFIVIPFHCLLIYNALGYVLRTQYASE